MRVKRLPQPEQIARRRHAQRHAPRQALQILHAGKVVADFFAQHRVVFQLLHGVEARLGFLRDSLAGAGSIAAGGALPCP